MISFKNVKGLALVTALGAGLVLSTGVAHADSTFSSVSSASSSTDSSSSTTTYSATGDTKASFTVAAGAEDDNTDDPTSTGGLVLESAPSFNFGTVTVKDIAAGNSSAASLSSSNSSSYTDDKDNTGIFNNSITVADYRGYSKNANWQVSAQLSDFSGINGTIALDLGNNSEVTTNGVYNNNLSSVNLSADKSTTVITGGDTNDNFTTDGAATAAATVTNATLGFSKQQATTGTKDATITWTLSNTATNN